MKKKLEPGDMEIMVELTHDPFMRNVSLHIHTSSPMQPADFVAELAEVVAQYQDCPDELFATAKPAIEAQ